MGLVLLRLFKSLKTFFCITLKEIFTFALGIKQTFHLTAFSNIISFTDVLSKYRCLMDCLEIS